MLQPTYLSSLEGHNHTISMPHFSKSFDSRLYITPDPPWVESKFIFISIPTSLEGNNHTIFTLRDQNQTIPTSLEGRNHTIFTPPEWIKSFGSRVLLPQTPPEPRAKIKWHLQSNWIRPSLHLPRKCEKVLAHLHYYPRPPLCQSAKIILHLPSYWVEG